MFVIAAATATAAVIARLAIDVRDDRPSSPPRSHFHEIDQYSSHAR